MPLASETYGQFTVEDLRDPAIPEKGVEILQGELIQMTPAGKYHNRVIENLVVLFRNFCRGRSDIDRGLDNEGFLLERNPDTLLSPDTCLFRPRPETEGPWMEFSPEIAVEVLSPSNSASEIAHKIRKYIECGSEQVWIVDPEKRAIEFYFPEGRKLVASGDEVVKGEGIAKGLEISLVEVFRED